MILILFLPRHARLDDHQSPTIQINAGFNATLNLRSLISTEYFKTMPSSSFSNAFNSMQQAAFSFSFLINRVSSNSFKLEQEYKVFCQTKWFGLKSQDILLTKLQFDQPSKQI